MHDVDSLSLQLMQKLHCLKKTRPTFCQTLSCQPQYVKILASMTMSA